MLTTIVTVQVTCDRCRRTCAQRLTDGSANKLMAAARRALVRRHGWRLAGRRPRRNRQDLCPGCAVRPAVAMPVLEGELVIMGADPVGAPRH